MKVRWHKVTGALYQSDKVPIFYGGERMHYRYGTGSIERKSRGKWQWKIQAGRFKRNGEARKPEQAMQDIEKARVANRPHWFNKGF